MVNTKRYAAALCCALPLAVLAASGSAAQRPQQTAGCPSKAAATAVGAKDGQFELRSDLSSNGPGDIAAFILIGKEAAAAGRGRDAEVAFLMSCHLAEQLKGAQSAESADARHQLARHYAQVAVHGSSAGPVRTELLQRAEALYQHSWNYYRDKNGHKHEKTRFAAEGLASVRTALAQAGRSTPASSPVLPRVLPSFDCSKARSVPEKMICADPELAQLDRDLGRLHARAKSSATDSAAFKRLNDREWRRREATCRDRECLLRWYEHRRAQLLDDVNRTQRPGAASASQGEPLA